MLNAPTPLAPVGGAAYGARRLLTVNNAPRTGPTCALVYRFEVSASPAFNPLALDATIPEGVAWTTYQPNVDLPAEVTLYWRASATDRANAASPASAVASFVTSLTIDLRKVVHRRSPDVADRPQTANLTLVEQDGAGEVRCACIHRPMARFALALSRRRAGLRRLRQSAGLRQD